MIKIILNEDNVWDYADGIDFCVIGSNQVTHSYTKEEFKNIGYYPKNIRRYWVMKDGEKKYLELDVETIISEDGRIYQEVK